MPTGARVKPVMGLFQPALIDVSVNLRRGNVRVPEHLLNDAQVAAMVKQVRGETMPECVR